MKRFQKHLGLVAIIFLLGMLVSGCATRSARGIQFYQMRFAEASASHENLRMGELALSDYLRPKGILLETGDNTLHEARYHLWSRPLHVQIAEGVERLIAMESAEQTLDGIFDLRVETFHTTARGTVLFEGQWRFTRGGSEESREVSDRFVIEVGLEESGYNAAVDAHEECLRQLARQVVDQLKVS